MSASFRSSPPRTASFSPFSLRLTSTQPVNRFFAFHSLSPWRRRISLYGASAMRMSVIHAFHPGGARPTDGRLTGSVNRVARRHLAFVSCAHQLSHLHTRGTVH